jgi:NAD(P)H dehydrogenase (quinone)
LSESNVLVIFYSRSGLTERLAVLLAEGAIQGGAKIRLRRCRDVMPEEFIAADATWRANRDRMHQEFAAPRMEDLAWADVIAFGTPAAPASVGPELGATLAQIGLQISSEALVGKGATAFSSSYGAVAGAEKVIADLQSRLLNLGFVTLPTTTLPAVVGASENIPADYEAARAHGRLAATLGRSLHRWLDDASA